MYEIIVTIILLGTFTMLGFILGLLVTVKITWKGGDIQGGFKWSRKKQKIQEKASRQIPGINKEMERKKQKESDRIQQAIKKEVQSRVEERIKRHGT